MTGTWRRSIDAGFNSSVFSRCERYSVVVGVEAFGSIMGQVIEVSGSSTDPRLHRVTVVYDCGHTVNPDTVAAEMQGAVVQGLYAALTGGMPFKEGTPTKQNYNNYSTGRLAGSPPVIDVTPAVNASTAPPGGVGEPGFPAPPRR